MADDNVEVSFGAKIDDLVSGIKSVNTNLESIKTKAGEVGEHTTGAFTQIREIAQGLSTPLRGIRENLGELAEAFVAGFAIEKIKEFIDAMTELGEKTSTVMAILGVNAKEFAGIQLIAGATGISLDSLVSSMSHLQTTLQKSEEPTGAVAQSLRALGLSARALQGIPIAQQMDKIADAVSKFADGGNKTAIVMNLLGRAGVQMIPTLNEGSEGLQAIRQSSIDASIGLTAMTTEGLERAKVSSVTFGQAVQSLGAFLVGQLGPTIQQVMNTLTDYVSGFNALIQTHGLAEASILELKFVWDFWIAGMKQNAIFLKDVFTLNWGSISSDWKAGTKELEKIVTEMTQNIGRVVGIAKQQLQSLIVTSNGDNAGKKQAPPISTGGGGISAAMKEADGEIKVYQEMLQQKKLLLEQATAQGLITEGQRVQKMKDYTEDEYEDEKAVLEKELALGNLSVTQRQEVLNKLRELEVKHENDMIKLNGEMVANIQKQWQGVADAFSSSFNGQLRGMLAGTTSFANAFKAIAGDMIIYFIEQVEKMALKWIVAKATELTVTETTETAKVAAVAAGAATGQAAQTAGALASIQRGVAATFANASAFFALALGPAAPAAAAGVSAAVEAQSVGLLATSAAGGDYEVSEGLYKLHEKEAVLPAPAAQAFRDMAEAGTIGGGNSHLHLHGNLIDGPSLARFARDNAGVFAGALKGFGKLNPSAR